MEERLELALGRIKEICEEEGRLGEYNRFFKETAVFIKDTLGVLDLPEKDRVMLTDSFYNDILPGAYNESFLNPTYACKIFGNEYGRLMSALAAEVGELESGVEAGIVQVNPVCAVILFFDSDV